MSKNLKISVALIGAALVAIMAVALSSGDDTAESADTPRDGRLLEGNQGNPCPLWHRRAEDGVGFGAEAGRNHGIGERRAFFRR